RPGLAIAAAGHFRWLRRPAGGAQPGTGGDAEERPALQPGHQRPFRSRRAGPGAAAVSLPAVAHAGYAAAGRALPRRPVAATAGRSVLAGRQPAEGPAAARPHAGGAETGPDVG